MLLLPVLLLAAPARTAADRDPDAMKSLVPDGQGNWVYPDAAEQAAELAARIDADLDLDSLGVCLSDVLSAAGWSGEDDAEVTAPEFAEELVEEARVGIPIGGHTGGRLASGIPFPEDDPRFSLIAGWRAYSTQRTIDGLGDAVDQVEALYPGTPPLTVGDVSRKGGGILSPHMSHQIGLDVDIGPYWADGEVHPLGAMSPQRLDMDRTWALLEALVSDERVQYIILDYRLQAVFYDYARELPWMDDAYLELIFQYPRGPKHHEGIIRDWEGHYSHFHVRFFCPEEFGDTCRG